MPPTITYLEFKPTSTPAVVKLYPVGGVDDTILATAGAIIQLDDPDTDETGRWRASYLDLTARDYQLIATEGGGSVVADERYTVTAATISSVIQPWSEAKPLTLAEIAAAVAPAVVSAIEQNNPSYLPTSTEVKRLTRGDSYDGTANPLVSFAVDKNYTGWTGTFTIRHRTTGESLLSRSVTVASSTLLTCSLTTTDTAFTDLVSDAEFGPHPFDVEMTSGDSQKTAQSGVVVIRKDVG